MATKRSTAQNTVLDQQPDPPPGGGEVVVTAAPPLMPLIGQACDPGTPGFIMGIGKAPESNAAHATRLGSSAGKFNDAGFILGTLAARNNWPAPPVVAAPAQAPTGTP